MNRIGRAVAVVALLALVAAASPAQEKPKLVPLKVQVVFSEFEGERKVANLPYSLLANATEGARGERSSLRIGVRVPIRTQTKDGPATQYLDVGTYIDCIAEPYGEGKFALHLNVRRSFIYSPAGDKKSEELPAEVEGTPIFRNFDADFRIILKDGETIQSMWATDPVSGRVLKVDVTLNVVK